MSTCNQLDSQTLGSQPIMPKNSPMVKPILDPPLSHRLGMWGGGTFKQESVHLGIIMIMPTTLPHS